MSRRHQHAFVMLIYNDILAGTYPNAVQLAEKYGVSKKTIDRNIRFLRSHHGLSVEVDRKQNGYYLEGKARLAGHVIFTAGDLMILGIAQSVYSVLHPTQRKLVMPLFKKLAAMLPEEMVMDVENLQEVIGFHSPAEANYKIEIFDLFMRASRDGLEMEIFYASPNKEPKWRKVKAYGFRFIGTDWYLFAWDEFYGKVVKFLPQRTLEAKLTGATFQKPEGWTVEKFLKGSFGVFSAEGNFDVVIRVRKPQAHRIREKRWPGQEKLVERPNGDVDLHLKLTSLVEIHEFIGRFDGDAFPIAPRELVEKYHCMHTKMAANFAEMEAGL